MTKSKSATPTKSKNEPITFRLCGQIWTVKFQKMEVNGGECLSRDRLIKIDEAADPEERWTLLTHEIMEGALYSSGCSYERNYPEDSTRFFMDHNDLSKVATEIASGLWQLRHLMPSA
jgi:hypothetical protein